MAKYKVLQKSFINGSLVEEGAVVEYTGEASGNLELIEDAPKKGKKAAPVIDDELPPGSA